MLKRLVLLLIVIFLAVACSVVEQSITPRSDNGLTNTPDPFDLTATQLVFEATETELVEIQATFEVTSGTYAAQATSGTLMARQTEQRMTQAVPITSTAFYWQTQGITPTFTPDYEATNSQIVVERSQTAVAAATNGCEQVTGFRKQSLVISFNNQTPEVSYYDDTLPWSVFRCPELSLLPSVYTDFFVTIVVPADATQDEMLEYVIQAIQLLPDNPFGETTLGTDNLQLSVQRINNPYDRYVMEFTYVDMLSALEDGLEEEALLEALGGVVAME